MTVGDVRSTHGRESPPILSYPQRRGNMQPLTAGGISDMYTPPLSLELTHSPLQLAFLPTNSYLLLSRQPLTCTMLDSRVNF